APLRGDHRDPAGGAGRSAGRASPPRPQPPRAGTVTARRRRDRSPRERTALLVTRRPWAVLAGAAAASLVLALGFPQLVFETSQEALIGEDHPISVRNAAFQRDFGGEAMIAAFTARDGGRIEDLLAPGNRDELRRLEET